MFEIVLLRFSKFFLILFIILYSNASIGKTGDVYFCTTEHVIEINKNKKKEYKNFTFKFKKNENSLVFGQGGYFNNLMISDKIQDIGGGMETFQYMGKDSTVNFWFHVGDFNYTFTHMDLIRAISGKCSIFN